MKKRYLMTFIVLLSIGFAAIATTLTINGTIKFGFNDKDYKIIFSKAVLDGVDKSESIIKDNGLSIEYETNVLTVIGTSSNLEFVVKNSSTQYDAKLSINCEVENPQYADYYTMEKSLPNIVKAGLTVEGNVKVTLIKSTVASIREKFKCTITTTAFLEEDEEPKVCTSQKICDSVTNTCFMDSNCNNKLDKFEEVIIGTEHFFLISGSSAESLTLFTKYNINTSTNLQYEDTTLNTTAFSEGVYWECPSASCKDENGKYLNLNELSSNQAIVVNAAKAYATNFGEGFTSRLLTYEEMGVFGELPNLEGSITGDEDILRIATGMYGEGQFLKYWLASGFEVATDSHSAGRVWGSGYGAFLSYVTYDMSFSFGVRPILEAPRNLIISD